MEWPACLNEIEKLLFRLDSPKVAIDNAVCPNTTIVKVDSARKHGILLEAVQVLTDLNLSIKKAYISSDGRWFMDVFHVTDLNGNKMKDEGVLANMEQSLESIHFMRSPTYEGVTALELTGTDRVGLLSEVFAVLSDMNCSVVDATVWTHNGRIASLIYIKDCDSGCEIDDSNRIMKIESKLRPVLKGDDDIKTAKTIVSRAVTHTERRLHQMMFEDRDYERRNNDDKFVSSLKDFPEVSVQNWNGRGYSVVNVQCKDRPKLLFDVVCTLTDMQYVVFHATVDTRGNRAYSEFYMKHADGGPIKSEAERQRVVQCIQAAIQRRASQGVRLELHVEDRPSLLADVNRTFRENSLNIVRAEISTTGDKACNIFYVTDSEGYTPDSKTIENVRDRVGPSHLNVKELPMIYHQETERDGHGQGQGQGVGVGGAMLLSLGSIVKKNLYNLGLIRSHS